MPVLFFHRFLVMLESGWRRRKNESSMHSSEKIMTGYFKLCWQVSVTQHVPPASQWKSQQPCTLLWRQSTPHPVNSIWNGMHRVMKVSIVWSSPGSHVHCLSPLVPAQWWPTHQFMVTELMLLTLKSMTVWTQGVFWAVWMGVLHCLTKMEWAALTNPCSTSIGTSQKDQQPCSWQQWLWTRPWDRQP